MVNNSVLLRQLTGTVGTMSVDGASNFFASSITFTASGDHIDSNGYLAVAFVSATANILSANLDDGGASVKAQLINIEEYTQFKNLTIYNWYQ